MTPVLMDEVAECCSVVLVLFKITNVKNGDTFGKQQMALFSEGQKAKNKGCFVCWFKSLVCGKKFYL